MATCASWRGSRWAAASSHGWHGGAPRRCAMPLPDDSDSLDLPVPRGAPVLDLLHIDRRAVVAVMTGCDVLGHGLEGNHGLGHCHATHLHANHVFRRRVDPHVVVEDAVDD